MIGAWSRALADQPQRAANGGQADAVVARSVRRQSSVQPSSREESAQQPSATQVRCLIAASATVCACCRALCAQSCCCCGPFVAVVRSGSGLSAERWRAVVHPSATAATADNDSTIRLVSIACEILRSFLVAQSSSNSSGGGGGGGGGVASGRCGSHCPCCGGTNQC